MGAVRGNQVVSQGGLRENLIPISHRNQFTYLESRNSARMSISSPSLRMWGRYEHSLDDKGRVIVPQKFREKLGEEFVLTVGPGRHIRVYPMPIWEVMEEQLVSENVH